MDESNKIFGVSSSASSVQSFSSVAAARLSSNPFAAVFTTANTVVGFSSAFGQSPVFTANADSATSSASVPLARFNFSAPTFAPQNPAPLSTSAGETSDKNIAESEVPLLFGKPVHDEPNKDNSDQEVETAQPSQLEPKRRWNAKSGGQRKTSASSALFGRTLASITQKQPSVKSAAVPVSSNVVTVTGECSNLTGSEKLSSSTPLDASAKSVVRRRVSTEDTSLVVKCVPDEYCNISQLKKHFAKYGVTRVYVNSRLHSATVIFRSHEHAADAKKHAHTLPDGRVLQMFWRATASKGSDSARKSPRQGVLSRAVSAKSVSKEVEDELASMRGTRDVEGISYMERKKIHGMSSVEEPDPRMMAGLSREEIVSEVSSSRVLSRESSPARPRRQPHSTGHVGMFAANSIVAHTAAERFALLDERDKLLRSKCVGARQSSLLTAEVVRGTCLDMCPEKERYMREDRRRLSVYEMVPGTDVPGRNPQVDHARAVKEYSRSSADQDMPLPEELRPVSVLDMTMNYLLNNIMDAGGPGKWDNWFDFLWNRTRSIRKDITQQQLCDLTSVSLIEKCTRFHIFCSEALCEEDMAVFDAKINNENLTKCLQTLKEMYTDLGSNHSVLCPREVEFRAYMVLMRLNDGDILREVQQLRSEVRESDAIKFAVDVYTSLNSFNYVKFFRLVRSATFLNACILHRYFSQMRACCLQRLRAYVMPGHTAEYPLSELIRLLALSDVTEATELCEHHGLTVTADGLVQMGKMGFVDPEVPLPPRRATQLINSKQTATLGEIVNGGPLPVNVVQEPVSLFDENGRFVGEHASEATDVTVSTLSDAEGVRVEVSRELIHEITKQIFHEVIDDICRHISTATADEHRRVVMLHTQSVSDELIAEFVSRLTGEVCSETLTECVMLAREQRARQRALTSILCERASLHFTDNLMQEFVAEFCLSIAHDVLREVRATERLIADISNDILDDIVRSVSGQETWRLAADFHLTDVVQRLDTLQRCCHVIEMSRLHMYLSIWKTRLSGRRRLKRLMQTFPSVPSLQFTRLLANSAGVSVLDSSVDVGGGCSSAQVTLHCPDDIVVDQQSLSEELDKRRQQIVAEREEAWAPLNLASVVYHNVPHSTTDSKRGFAWKLAVALPDASSSQQLHELSVWLQSKLSVGSVPSGPADSHMSMWSLYSSRQSMLSVGICVVAESADVSHDELHQQRRLLGTSALIFVPSFTDVISMQSERDRLMMLLSSKPRHPPTPLCVLCVDSADHDVSSVTSDLQLNSLQTAGLVSEYRVYTLGFNVTHHTTTRILSDAVEWLCSQSQSLSLDIESQSIVDYVEDGLTAHFFTPVLQDLSQRHRPTTTHSTCHANAELLIDLYNEVIVWLADIASHHSLQQLSWPIPEFSEFAAVDRSWNTERQLSVIRETILSLRLPQFTPTRRDWSPATVNEIHNYICALIGQQRDPITSCRAQLSSRIDCILHKAAVRQRAAAAGSYVLPWTDIITACVDYQLVTLRYHHVSSQLDGDRSSSQLMVHHVPQLLKQLPPPVLVSVALPSSVTDTVSDSRKLPVKASVKRKQQEFAAIDVEVTKHARSTETNTADGCDLRDGSVDRSSLDNSRDSWWVDTEARTSQLQQLVERERQQSDDFEAYLRRMLSTTDVSPVSDSSQVLCDRESGPPTVQCGTSLAERISQLENCVMSERDADKLFELQLLHVCLCD